MRGEEYLDGGEWNRSIDAEVEILTAASPAPGCVNFTMGDGIRSRWEKAVGSSSTTEPLEGALGQ